jgi:hypothetical protein
MYQAHSTLWTFAAHWIAYIPAITHSQKHRAKLLFVTVSLSSDLIMYVANFETKMFRQPEEGIWEAVIKRLHKQS